MAQKKTMSAAVVTIKRPQDMTKKGRRDMAKWLRDRADDLERHGAQLTGRDSFVCRYTVPA